MSVMAISLLAGLAAGILSGLLGVGGGLILIPIMVFLLEMSQHAAQGVSLLVIIPTALAGIRQLHKAKMVNYPLAAYLAAGAIVGATISANFVQYIPGDILKRVFGLFVIAIGLRTFISVLGSSKK